MSMIWMWFLLGFLILLSGFFSGSETGVMSLNQYRLRHKARAGDRRAKRVVELLKRPDRLLGVILLGNTFANILASAVATILAVRYFGEVGVFFSTLAMPLCRPSGDRPRSGGIARPSADWRHHTHAGSGFSFFCPNP